MKMCWKEFFTRSTLQIFLKRKKNFIQENIIQNLNSQEAAYYSPISAYSKKSSVFKVNNMILEGCGEENWRYNIILNIRKEELQYSKIVSIKKMLKAKQ